MTNNFTPHDRFNHRAGSHRHRILTTKTLYQRRVGKLMHDNAHWSLSKARRMAQEQLDAEEKD